MDFFFALDPRGASPSFSLSYKTVAISIRMNLCAKFELYVVDVKYQRRSNKYHVLLWRSLLAGFFNGIQEYYTRAGFLENRILK